jgi:hypothetical protein
VKLLKRLSFEWNCAVKHGIEQDSKTPDVDEETFIALVYDYLRR